MGTANSRPKFSGSNLSEARNTDAEKKPDANAAGPDANAELGPGADELSMKEVKKWKGFLSGILSLKEAKDKLKTLELDEKVKAEAKEPPLYAKGIYLTADIVKKFASGDKEFLPDLKLFLGTGIPSKDAPLKFDAAAAEPLSMGTSSWGAEVKTPKKEVTFEAVKPIFDKLIEAARIAKKHAVLRKIITEYVADLKTFKATEKAANISGAKDAITSGEEDAASKAKANIAEGKGNPGGDTPPNPPAAKGGSEEGGKDEGEEGEGEEEGDKEGEGEVSDEVSDEGEDKGDDEVSDDEDTDSHEENVDESDSDVGENTSPDGGSEGGDPLSGGVRIYGFRTAKELQENKQKDDYKKFKKEARGDFKEKMKTFFDDNEALAKFMDTNEEPLLKMVYYGKIPGKWVDKSETTAKQQVNDALVAAINAYTPPGIGEGVPGIDGPPGHDGPSEDKGAAAEVKAPAAAAEVKAEGAAAPAPAPAEGAEVKAGPGGQGGGGKKSHPKKKKFTRKKHRHVNISINVGNKNAITNSSSDSSSSDSDSSSSDSDTSDSDTSSSCSSSSSSDTSSSDTSSSSSSSDESRSPRKKKYKRRHKRGSVSASHA